MINSTKSSLFNQYFVSVFTKEDLSSLPEVSPFCSGFTLDQFSVTPSEIFAKLSALNTGQACGLDGICPRLLKEGAEHLAAPLATLFNKSLAEGVLPQDWISANITPVFKNGNKHLIFN